MRALYDLVYSKQWQVAITHIQSLADDDSVDPIFFQDGDGCTAIIYACVAGQLELVQLMITKAKFDQRKRCLLAITTMYGSTALHCAARFHTDRAVLELLICEHPLALSATDSSGRAPLQRAIQFNKPAPIISLLTDTTNALAAGDYATFATLVHGDERTLRCLVLTPDRLAVRVSLLLSIKHGYVNIRRSKRHRPDNALDTPLAFAKLNDNVWSHVMTFL